MDIFLTQGSQITKKREILEEDLQKRLLEFVEKVKVMEIQVKSYLKKDVSVTIVFFSLQEWASHMKTTH